MSSRLFFSAFVSLIAALALACADNAAAAEAPVSTPAEAQRLANESFAAADEYMRIGEHGRARIILEALLAKLDPVRDLRLVREADRRLERAGRLERAAADREARALLAKAKRLEDDEEFDDAAATYKVVADRKPTEVSPALIQAARLAQIRAETAALDEDPFWDSAWGPVEGAAEKAFPWIMLALAAGVLVFIARLVAWELLPPKRRVVIALEDLTSETSERNAKNHALARELRAEIEAAVRRSGEGFAEIDESRDLDGSALATLAVLGESVERAQTLIEAETPIRVGPVSFSPRQLMYFARATVRRRSESELVGSLVASGSRTHVSIEQRTNAGPPPRRWHAVCDGDDGREKALADVARQMAVELVTPYLTTSWRSLTEYQAGMEKLSAAPTAADSRAAAREAQRCFQRAVDHDPRNLLARFYLATVLRTLADNRSAVRQLAFLERLVRVPGVGADPIGQFVRRHPEFHEIVRYNRAVALSKVFRWECHTEAMAILDELDRQLEDPVAAGAAPHERLVWPALKLDEANRLKMLVRAARAATLVFRLEQWRFDDETERLEAARARVLEEIASVRGWLDELQIDAPIVGPKSMEQATRKWTAYVRARATAQNAYGRALYLLERNPEALDELESAVSLMPDYADAYVNLASVLLDEGTGVPDREARAEECLLRALELSPLNEKAHYLLGRLYTSEGRRDEAKQAFGKARHDPRSLARMAELLAAEGDLAGAVERLRRSLALSARPDYRLMEFLEYALALARADKAELALLAEAERVGSRLVKFGRPPGIRARGEPLLAEVRRLLERAEAAAANAAAV